MNQNIPNHKKRNIRPLWVVYAVLMAGLLAAFTICDFRNEILIANRLKFASIALNTLALLLACARKRYAVEERRDILRVGALLATLAADVFLILLDRDYELGVLLFCLVETLYFLSIQRPAALWIRAVIRLGIFGTALLALHLMGALDLLTGASVYSMVMLTMNVVEAFGEARQENGAQRPGLFAIGLLLFWCCDASVGLRNLPAYFPGAVWNMVAIAAGYAIWWFYLPAQILIMVSGIQHRMEKENE